MQTVLVRSQVVMPMSGASDMQEDANQLRKFDSPALGIALCLTGLSFAAVVAVVAAIAMKWI